MLGKSASPGITAARWWSPPSTLSTKSPFKTKCIPSPEFSLVPAVRPYCTVVFTNLTHLSFSVQRWASPPTQPHTHFSVLCNGIKTVLPKEKDVKGEEVCRDFITGSPGHTATKPMGGIKHPPNLEGQFHKQPGAHLLMLTIANLWSFLGIS